MKRILLSFLIAGLTVFSLVRLYYRLTDDFRLGNISYEIHYNPDWDTPSSDQDQKKLNQILQQKFYYIGKGAQSYAFTSEDGQYVLKFFKFKHLKPNWFVDLIPSVAHFKQYKEQILERKRRKLQGVFEGYALAFRENKENAGLLYMHLLPTRHLHQKAVVIDKLGLAKSINLDDVVFLIQNRGETFRTRLHRLLSLNQIEAAKQSIGQIISMYMSEYGKGLYDRDHGVMHNTGFVSDKPFHLDVGKLTKDETMQTVNVFKKDLEHIVWKIDTWIKATYPQHHASLSSYLENQYFQQTGNPIDIASIDPMRYKKRKH